MLVARDHCLKEVTQRVHDNVTLAPTNFLAGVVATLKTELGSVLRFAQGCA